MKRHGRLSAGGRARSLQRDADRSLEVAAELDRVADEVADRLRPVIARMGPGVWAGDAADHATEAAHAARDDLLVAATSLREVAQDLRVQAATLAWRAEQLGVEAERALPAGHR
jgi:hypothetical protein